MNSRYENITKRATEQGIKYLTPVFYPKVEPQEDDIYIITTAGDRYDILALEFYGQADYWWVIMAANSEVVAGDSLAIQPGTQIRIPAEPENYVIQYQNLNNK